MYFGIWKAQDAYRHSMQLWLNKKRRITRSHVSVLEKVRRLVLDVENFEGNLSGCHTSDPREVLWDDMTSAKDPNAVSAGSSPSFLLFLGLPKLWDSPFRIFHFAQLSAFTEVGAPFGAPLPLQSFFGFYTVFGSDWIGHQNKDNAVPPPPSRSSSPEIRLSHRIASLSHRALQAFSEMTLPGGWGESSLAVSWA